MPGSPLVINGQHADFSSPKVSPSVAASHAWHESDTVLISELRPYAYKFQLPEGDSPGY